MSWENWQNPETRQRLSMILDGLVEIVTEVASQHSEWGAHIIPAQWDAPNVELRWHSLGLERNVNLLVVGTRMPVEIEFTGAAWLDDPGSGRWVRQIDFSHTGPMQPLTIANAQDLHNLVPAALEAAVAQIQTIRRAAAAGAAGR